MSGLADDYDPAPRFAWAGTPGEGAATRERADEPATAAAAAQTLGDPATKPTAAAASSPAAATAAFGTVAFAEVTAIAKKSLLPAAESTAAAAFKAAFVTDEAAASATATSRMVVAAAGTTATTTDDDPILNAAVIAVGYAFGANAADPHVGAAPAATAAHAAWAAAEEAADPRHRFAGRFAASASDEDFKGLPARDGERRLRLTARSTGGYQEFSVGDVAARRAEDVERHQAQSLRHSPGVGARFFEGGKRRFRRHGPSRVC